MSADEKKRFTVPIGPQHPALKEPGHFAFEVDGEVVKSATVRLGYAHRGIEKATESRTWVQNLYLLERVCGICSHIHATAYCLGVERLAGVTVPPRAQFIRTIVAEIERLHSHFLWLGVAAHEAGFDTLFMYSWRDRETIMDMLETLTGNRVNYSLNVLGGVKYDIEPEHDTQIREGLSYLFDRIQHYIDVVTHDTLFLRRTDGIAVTSCDAALSAGLTGPTARASGVQRDIRCDAPYLAYRDMPLQITTETDGDLKARFVIRLREMLESCRYIEVLLDNLPDTDLTVRMPRRIKAGEAISRVEAPRGELFYFIKSNGSDMPERIHIKTPTLANIASVAQLVIGQFLADVPLILIGIDPCFSCNDRMVIRKNDTWDVWDGERLRQYGIQYYGSGGSSC